MSLSSWVQSGKLTSPGPPSVNSRATSGLSLRCLAAAAASRTCIQSSHALKICQPACSACLPVHQCHMLTVCVHHPLAIFLACTAEPFREPCKLRLWVGEGLLLQGRGSQHS